MAHERVYQQSATVGDAGQPELSPISSFYYRQCHDCGAFVNSLQPQAKDWQCAWHLPKERGGDSRKLLRNWGRGYIAIFSLLYLFLSLQKKNSNPL